MIRVAQIRLYMAGKSAPAGVVLAKIALRQHGVVSRAQILADEDRVFGQIGALLGAVGSRAADRTRSGGSAVHL